MSRQTADMVAEGSVLANDPDIESSLHSEIRQLLAESDGYPQPRYTEVASVPNLQISSTEDFTSAGLNLSTTSDATQLTPQAEVEKTDAGLFGVVGDIFGGAINHLITNPMSVVQAIGTGVVVSFAVGAAIAGATALAASAPAWVPVAGSIAMIGGALGLTGWLAAEYVPKWWKDADTVWNSSKHTDEEVAAARKGLQDLGGGTVDFMASMVGGTWLYNHLTKAAVNVATNAAAIEIKAVSTEARGAAEGVEQAATTGNLAAAEGVEQAATNINKAASEGVAAETGETQIQAALNGDPILKRGLDTGKAVDALERTLFPSGKPGIPAVAAAETAELATNLAGTAARLEAQTEISAFVQQFARMNPSFRSEINLALKVGIIPEKAAPLWKEAMEAIPSSGADDVIRASFTGTARSQDELVAAMQAESRNTLLTPDQYAFTHLSDPEEIIHWIRTWKFDTVNELVEHAKPLNALLDDVQPGTKRVWLDRFEEWKHLTGMMSAFL